MKSTIMEGGDQRDVERFSFTIPKLIHDYDLHTAMCQGKS